MESKMSNKRSGWQTGPLHLHCTLFSSSPRSQPELLASVVDALQSAGLWLDFKKLRRRETTNTYRTLDDCSPAALIAEARDSRFQEAWAYAGRGTSLVEGHLTYLASVTTDEPFERSNWHSSFALEIGATAWPKIDRIVDKIERFFTDLARDPSWIAIAPSDLGIPIGGEENGIFESLTPPRVRPPRDFGRWRPSVLRVWDARWPIAAGQTFLRRATSARSVTFAEITRAALPADVRRTQVGQVSIDRWCDRLDDRADLERSIAQQQMWLGPLFEPPILWVFNEYGDDRVPPPPYGHLEAQPPGARFEWRDHERRVARARMSGDVLDALAIKELVTAAAAASQGLDLVFRDRQAAVKGRPAAKALGVGRTLFEDVDGALWNIHPLELYGGKSRPVQFVDE